MNACVCVCVCVCLCTVALLSAMLWIWNRAASICTAAIPPRPPHCAYCLVQLASLQKHRSVCVCVCVCQRELSLLVCALFVWVRLPVSPVFGFWESLFVFTCTGLISSIYACIFVLTFARMLVAASLSVPVHLYCLRLFYLGGSFVYTQLCNWAKIFLVGLLYSLSIKLLVIVLD